MVTWKDALIARGLTGETVKRMVFMNTQLLDNVIIAKVNYSK
jgi:hypothetical protein